MITGESWQIQYDESLGLTTQRRVILSDLGHWNRSIKYEGQEENDIVKKGDSIFRRSVQSYGYAFLGQLNDLGMPNGYGVLLHAKLSNFAVKYHEGKLQDKFEIGDG
jgi:hypothetical protein